MKVLFTIIIMSFGIVSFSQEIKDSVFNEFISYFTDETYARIPKDFFLDNYSSVCSNEIISVIYAQEILEFDKSIICFIQIDFPFDTPVYDFYYIIFSKNGQILESKKFAGTNKMSDGKGTFASYAIFGDSLLQVYKDTYGIESYEHFIVNENGIERFFNFKYPSKGRKYPYTMERCVTEKELKDIPKPELDIMRNEIFADHGYIFKSEKWQKYFSKQDWYKPQFEDVNDKLSLFEKINVQTILNVSENMQDE